MFTLKYKIKLGKKIYKKIKYPASFPRGDVILGTFKDRIYNILGKEAILFCFESTLLFKNPSNKVLLYQADI